jgi:hypothetical protein
MSKFNLISWSFASSTIVNSVVEVIGNIDFALVRLLFKHASLVWIPGSLKRRSLLVCSSRAASVVEILAHSVVLLVVVVRRVVGALITENLIIMTSLFSFRDDVHAFFQSQFVFLPQ